MTHDAHVSSLAAYCSGAGKAGGGFSAQSTGNLGPFRTICRVPARSDGKSYGTLCISVSQLVKSRLVAPGKCWGMCESSLTTIPARDVYRRENYIAPDMCIA